MPEEVAYPRATAANEYDCFVLFRASLHDAMIRGGYVAAGTPPPGLNAACNRQRSLFAQLTASRAQWWPAEDSEGSRYLPLDPCVFL